jgi:hypothetical protein
MSLQIEKLLLYSRAGELRELPFRRGQLNIITGASRTGKSAILDIVDYCLGSRECNVAAGVIRDTVSWFAVLFSDDASDIFVARRAPRQGFRSSTDIYIEVGSDLEPVPFARLAQNTTPDAARSLMSRKLGIADTELRPPIGQTRRPLAATVRHAVHFCFQGQNEISNRIYLFHGQADRDVAQSIKDTFPYFLGAMSEDRVQLQSQLDSAQREVQRIERLIGVMEKDGQTGDDLAKNLAAEAMLSGLLPDMPLSDDLGELRTQLRDGITPNRLADLQGEVGSSEVLSNLRSERQQLRQELEHVRDQIRDAQLFFRQQQGFSGEVAEHRARLSSIDLFMQPTEELHRCPLCESELLAPLPTLQQLERSTMDLQRQLSAVEAETPRVREYLEELVSNEERLVQALRSNQQRQTNLNRENDRILAQYDNALAQSRVVGRISQYLESIPDDQRKATLYADLENARALAEALEQELDFAAVDNEVSSIVNIVSSYLTEYADALSLEHTGSPVRLDISRLTVTADTENGPVMLRQMGSGENWVGYHVTTHLALHRWFRLRSRPVPGFLILDQPSQAHYPPEKDPDIALAELTDEDTAAVRTLFRLLYDVVSQIAPNLQLIVMDHARIEEPWFLESIVENWRDGNALIPTEWISAPSS